MNDQELDALLDIWEAPEPSTALRESVRQGMPHRSSKRSYRWLAAAAAVVVTAGLAGIAAMGSGHAQLSGGGSSKSFFEHVSHNIAERHLQFALWVQSLFGAEAHHVSPKLYVDGQLADSVPQSLSKGPGIHFYLPEQNVYVMTLDAPGIELQPAGTVHDATVKFEWEGRKYRIAGGKRLIASGEQAVYVLKYEDFHRMHR